MPLIIMVQSSKFQQMKQFKLSVLHHVYLKLNCLFCFVDINKNIIVKLTCKTHLNLTPY